MCIALSGCLPDNPGGATSSETGNATSSGEAPDNLLGCDEGSCWVLLSAQTLDDRVEIFGGPAGEMPAYRGAIDLDLKPGTELGPLDEPFGMALSDLGLHVVTGHYPTRELGAMLSFPSAFFDERAVGTIARDEFFNGGAFLEGVIETRFNELEPIFAVPDPVQGKLIVSVFANDFFQPDDTWVNAGKLAIVDALDPTSFGISTLRDLDGGDCAGASQAVLLEDDSSLAVACDGNEAVAFLDLGDLSGSPQDAAAGITGRLCNLPFMNDRRARYLAHDGAGGVLLGLGPTPFNSVSSQIYSISSDCTPVPINVADMDGQLGELVPFGDQHWLLAQGALAPGGERGIKVIGSMGVCQTLGGLDDAWLSQGDILSPYAIAVAPDLSGVAIGAGPASSTGANAIFGKVLWATLAGAEDPCSMTADVVDLTDGGAGHAPAPVSVDTSSWRRAPNVLVLAETQP